MCFILSCRCYSLLLSAFVPSIKSSATQPGLGGDRIEIGSQQICDCLDTGRFKTLRTGRANPLNRRNWCGRVGWGVFDTDGWRSIIGVDRCGSNESSPAANKPEAVGGEYADCIDQQLVPANGIGNTASNHVYWVFRS